jgi:hypothetical protein
VGSNTHTIPGIYNYCDRWCEKCKYTNHCSLFLTETQSEVDLILSDEDINDPDVYSKIVRDSLHKSFNKILNEKDDENIDKYIDDDFSERSFGEDEDLIEDEDDYEDYEEIIAEENKFRNAEHTLIKKSEKFFDDIFAYHEVNENKFAEMKKTEDTTNPFHQSWDTLFWYSPQIHIKIRMCFYSLEKLKRDIVNEFETEMMNVNSRIAYTGMEKIIEALRQLAEIKTEHEQILLLLLNSMTQIKEEFTEIFPEAVTFKRPYFDE